jgi:hypothetical protein
VRWRTNQELQLEEVEDKAGAAAASRVPADGGGGQTRSCRSILGSRRRGRWVQGINRKQEGRARELRVWGAFGECGRARGERKREGKRERW